MPNRQLTQQDNFETISAWLDKNLINPFKANMQSLPPEDNSRGIYFWFMRVDGYQRMSELGFNITAVNPVYTREINGNMYHLVYLGTAGTHRSQNNTLFLRLSWHISDNHNQSNICHKTLSTLRQTVGAILSDDLILPNTENLVNDFLDQFLYIYSLSYSRAIYDATNINSDEKKLIIEIKPLLNIKENPNALNIAPNNPTKLIDSRRKAILQSTQYRLGCIKNINRLNKKEKDKILPNSNHIKPFQTNNCIEFDVKKDESIQDIVKSIQGIPNQEFTIELFEKNDPKNRIYEKRSGTRKTNIIYKYFGNTDNNQPRWKVIQQEMLDKGIEEITVRVCSDAPIESNELEPSKEKRGRGRPRKYEMENTTPNVKNVKVEKTLNELKAELQKLNLSKNFKVVLTCASKKHPNNQLQYNGNQIEFTWIPTPNSYNPFSLTPNNNITWKNHIDQINQGIINSNIVSSFNLYNPKSPYQNIYVDLHNRFLMRFYIASAGWGIIINDFRLPDYDITFSGNVNNANFRNPNNGFVNDFNHLLPDNEDIIFIGSKKYLQQFISLTEVLPNRKIVFCNSLNIVLPQHNPYGGEFIPLYFPFPSNYTWQYAAAQMLIAI